MREELLYFIWKNSHFTFNGQVTTEGELLEVVHPGDYNGDSGPDFFNAKVRIGGTLWAGNVEMHINSSDWYAHGHHCDSAFDNVILHVVVNDDEPAMSSKGRRIPTLTTGYPDSLEWSLLHMTTLGKWIPCEDSFSSFDTVSVRMWLDNLSVERLEQKVKQVATFVDDSSGSWEDAFYISMARSFGLRVNALPFELLAKVTSLKVLAKHKNSLFQLEALLFGQSGLLPESNFKDDYTRQLRAEYQFLQHKFNLTPIQGHLWKFLRMRPTAFPTIRIAQFASLIYRSSSLFSKIIDINDIKGIIQLIQVEPSEYWKSHYTFGKVSTRQPKHLGEETIRTIAINSIVPFVFAYGSSKGRGDLKQKAMGLLEGISPESNTIIKGFKNIGLSAESAHDTQAMIHLKTGYCDTKKCLYCHLGAKLLLKSISKGDGKIE